MMYTSACWFGCSMMLIEGKSMNRGCALPKNELEVTST